MTTEIYYRDGRNINVVCPEGEFINEADEFNRHHEGVWNSRVLAFVPQACTHDGPPCDIRYQDGVMQVTSQSDTHFSDGTPVASYEQFN